MLSISSDDPEQDKTVGFLQVARAKKSKPHKGCRNKASEHRAGEGWNAI